MWVPATPRPPEHILLLFGVVALAASILLVGTYPGSLPPARVDLLERTSKEIASVKESLWRRGNGRRYLNVRMTDGEMWQYDDSRPGYEEALAVLLAGEPATLLADREQLWSVRNCFGYKSPHQIYELVTDGRVVISYDQLAEEEKQTASTALVLGLTVAPLIALVCLGGYALHRRQRRELK